MFNPLSVRSPSPRVADFDFEGLDSPPASPDLLPDIARHPAAPGLLGDLPARASAGADVRFLPPAPLPPIDEALLASPLPASLAHVLALMCDDLAALFASHSCRDRTEAWSRAAVACIMGLPLHGDFSPEEGLLLRTEAALTSPEAILGRPADMLQATLWLGTRRISMIAREQCAIAGAPREDVERVVWHLEAYASQCVERLQAMGPRV
jgi:hypothetical protein